MVNVKMMVIKFSAFNVILNYTKLHYLQVCFTLIHRPIHICYAYLILGLIGAGRELFDCAGLAYSNPAGRNGEIGLPPRSENATVKTNKQIIQCHNLYL